MSDHDQLLAGRLRTGQDNRVVLSGRCGTCGYLLTSAGHKVSCGDTPATAEQPDPGPGAA